MGKKWRQLKYEDRLKIYAWLQDKISVATIAKRLGVCRQTIYREIKRGEFVKRNTDYTESTVYDPYVAEEHYQKKLKERGRDLKIGSDLKLLHKERYLFKYNDGRFAGEEKAAQKEKSKGTKESAGGG